MKNSDNPVILPTESHLQKTLKLSARVTRFRFIGWFSFTNAIVFMILGKFYLDSIFLSAALYKNSIVNYTDFFGKLFIVVFALVNYCSYMMMLAFIPGVFLIALTFFMPNIRWLFITSVLTFTFAVIFLIVDSNIFRLFKFHINGTIFSFILNNDILDLSVLEKTLFIGLSFCIIIIEFLIARYLWKNVARFKSLVVERTIGIAWVVSTLFCYTALIITMGNGNNLLMQQTSNLPLYSQLFSLVIFDKNAKDLLFRFSENLFAQPYFPNQSLNYPLNPMRCPPLEKPYNLIFIMVDSLRADALQSKYMPLTTEFSAKGWNFLQHLSGGNATQPGLFSLFYSIPGSYWTAALEQKKPPVMMDLLRQRGYIFKIFWSSTPSVPPFDKTIFLGEKVGFHTDNAEKSSSSQDKNITKNALNFLNSKPQAPFFLNLFYNSPHAYCQDQFFTGPIKPALNSCLRFDLNSTTDRIPLYNRYLNAVRFIDGEISQLLNRIEEFGYLKNSVVILTSDHGQEFNDNKHNYWEHASNFTNVQVQVPLVIFWPGKSPQIYHHLTTHYDVVPTLLSRLFSCENSFSDYSIGQDLFNPHRSLPFVLAGGYVNMGLISPNSITTLESSGNISITDKKGNIDADLKVDEDSILQAVQLMRKYYSANR